MAPDLPISPEDARLRTMATRRPVRVPRPGKADLGGRMRVAAILQNAEIPNPGTPRRIAGATNEVWQSGNFIIRVGFVPNSNRLRREAALSEYLPKSVLYPKVITSGLETFGEWMILRRMPGEVLAKAWATMDRPKRESVVIQLVEILKIIHGTWPGEDVLEEFAFSHDATIGLPHALPAQRLFELIESAYDLPFLDRKLLDDAGERVASVADAMDINSPGMIHGDLHFENVLVQDGEITAVLDFEWARPGLPELDIDVLSRFLHEPNLHVASDYPLDDAAFKRVLPLIAEHYPDLFEQPRFSDRLMLSALAFEIPRIIEAPPKAPIDELDQHHPVNRLRDLLDKGTHAEQLGW